MAGMELEFIVGVGTPTSGKSWIRHCIRAIQIAIWSSSEVYWQTYESLYSNLMASFVIWLCVNLTFAHTYFCTITWEWGVQNNGFNDLSETVLPHRGVFLQKGQGGMQNSSLRMFILHLTFCDICTKIVGR